MQSGRENKSRLELILTIMLIVSVLTLSFMLGIRHGDTEANGPATGCWKSVMTGSRSIAIKVNGRDIEKVMTTARHEICHEIHYRLNRDNFSELTKDEKEGFANTCDPLDYLEVK